MRRLIDANALIATMKEMYCDGCEHHHGVRCRACDFDCAIQDIENAPTVDAVEVVRCKECKMRCPESVCIAKHCTLTGIPVDDDDFCSYGERRTDV